MVAHNTIHGSSNPVERPEPVVNIGNGHKVALAVCKSVMDWTSTASGATLPWMSALHSTVWASTETTPGARPVLIDLHVPANGANYRDDVAAVIALQLKITRDRRLSQGDRAGSHAVVTRLHVARHRAT